MKKVFRKTILSACLILPFLFASCLTTKVNKIPYEFNEINQESDYLYATILYPSFDDLPGFSNKIKNLVESGYNQFKPYAEEQWNEINSLNSEASSVYPPFEYIVDSKVSYSGDIVSVYIETYRYAGGAHGETFIKTFNYDINTGKEINILEFTGYTTEQLSDICRKQLYKTLISDNKFEMTQEAVELLDEMIEEGTEPSIGNFQNFTVDNNVLKIYFDPYTVAPYSYGCPIVTLKL